jgi:hypothetical protein
MIELGPATEDQMVLAFLRAEIESPRFSQFYRQCLDQLQEFGVSRETLIDDPDLASSRDNSLRITILRAVRGYRGNTLLFTGFPTDVVWRRIAIEQADWTRVKYANYPTWKDLSLGTRIVADGAQNLDSVVAAEDVNKNVAELVAELKKGKQYPELIGVQNENDEIVLVEGHSRATAYALAGLVEPIGSIVGSSPNMKDWGFY